MRLQGFGVHFLTVLTASHIVACVLMPTHPEDEDNYRPIPGLNRRNFAPEQTPAPTPVVGKREFDPETPTAAPPQITKVRERGEESLEGLAQDESQDAQELRAQKLVDAKEAAANFEAAEAKKTRTVTYKGPP